MNTIFERKIMNIFLFINFDMCFGCSIEPSSMFDNYTFNYARLGPEWFNLVNTYGQLSIFSA